MTKAKQIRVLILLLALVPLAYLLFMEHDPRPDWTRTKVVVIYPHDPVGHEGVTRWIDELDPADFHEIEEFFTREAAAHDLELDRPIEIRLAEPIDFAPPTPPRNGTFRERMNWAVRMRWWHFRFSRRHREADTIVIAHYHAPNNTERTMHSIGMPRPRLALANLIAGDHLARYNNLQLAHEILHTFGASDLYHFGTGHPESPEGYAQPESDPLYPQQEAEIMAMRIPTAPDQSRPALNLDEATIGPQTAREIGW
jgi:hypothetical protein